MLLILNMVLTYMKAKCNKVTFMNTFLTYCIVKICCYREMKIRSEMDLEIYSK